MPELPEVETVKRTLEQVLIGRKIETVHVLYAPIVAQPSVKEFCQCLEGETIRAMKRRGKWLLFETDHYELLSHLRMEGKYLFRDQEEVFEKHEHIAFTLDNGKSLRYQDTRKFGRMYLFELGQAAFSKPLNQVGLEPWDDLLSEPYLKGCFARKTLPIKTVLLDQSIIAGIGNIYANEILFLSKIDPFKKASTLTTQERKAIILNTQKVLEQAIVDGGTTIRSYESSEGVHGRFQQSLFVHGREGESCQVCGNNIVKTYIGGRGTYYCIHCQKVHLIKTK